MLRIRSTALMTLTLMTTGQAQGQEARLERQVLAMGTTLGLDLSGPSEAHLQAASEKALAEVARIEAGISTWREDSVFSRLNRAQGAPVHLENEWFDLLAAVSLFARRTEGAFDPTLGPLIEAWGLRAGGATPTPRSLARARRASGLALLKLDPARGTVQFLRPDAGLEEGGFGKGYGLDRLAETLRSSGTESGLLDFGGQLLAFGAPRRVALADPRDRFHPRLSILLRGASLASSGTSEKGAHILDPKTGRPAPGWGSVGVVASSGLEADCLSTALFVLGPRRGLRWAVAHRVPACFLRNDGRLLMSPAFRALAPSFS